MALKYQKNDKDRIFSLEKKEIESAEKELGFQFPSDLREFYLKFGYGFIGDDPWSTVRLMDPFSVKDFHKGEGNYTINPEVDFYYDYIDDKVVIFEEDAYTFLFMGLNDQKIYYCDEVVAESLDDFIEKMHEKPGFYNDLLDEDFDE